MRFIVIPFLLISIHLSAQQYTIVLHGGAGDGIISNNLSPELQTKYEDKMKEALLAGAVILDTGGAAVDAVAAVLCVMEDSPLFNAGKGAVFTWDETNELDASIMDGSDLNAGAVAGVGHIKNPILAALAVMRSSSHVMLSGDGADDFARAMGLEMVDNEYFFTEKSFENLMRYKKSQGFIDDWESSKMGTAGCVVLDKAGNLAAGTSTGGITGKRHGRIGDSPVIGAGTYASNETCAISCTGHGEYFIRYAVAHDMHSRMKYQNLSIQQAAAVIIGQVLMPVGGKGGLIGVDKDGNIAIEFNTAGMFRAYLKEGEPAVTALFAK